MQNEGTYCSHSRFHRSTEICIRTFFDTFETILMGKINYWQIISLKITSNEIWDPIVFSLNISAKYLHKLLFDCSWAIICIMASFCNTKESRPLRQSIKTVAQVLSREFLKIFKNTFFIEQIRATDLMLWPRNHDVFAPFSFRDYQIFWNFPVNTETVLRRYSVTKTFLKNYKIYRKARVFEALFNKATG